VRIDGVTRQRSDAFESLDLGVQGASFPTIARQQAAASAQIGAWASRPLRSRAATPSSGRLRSTLRNSWLVPFRDRRIGPAIASLIMEFWQDRPFRLHDRVEFRRADLGQPWRKTRLYP